MRQFDPVHAMIRANPGTIAWARTAADVRANAKRGRISAVFGVEGGHALLPGNEAEMLEHLRTFYERGARYLTLMWSVASSIGGSSGDDSDGRGVRGRQQRRGMREGGRQGHRVYGELTNSVDVDAGSSATPVSPRPAPMSR